MELQKKIYNFILDFWKLVKKYTPKPNVDDIKVWDELLAESKEMLEKHKDDTPEYQLFKEWLFVWFDYIGKEKYVSKRGEV